MYSLMRPWLKTIRTDIAVLLLGVLLALAFAPYEIFPFAILAPAGLLALSLRVSPKRGFYLGFIFGIGLFGAGVYWVFHSIHTFGGVPDFPAGLITAGMIAILALYPAYTTYLSNRYFPAVNDAKIILAFPAIWVTLEWVRSWLFTGFPWLFLGYSQTNSPLRGYAPLLSVYGVSLAVIMTSSLLVNAIIKLKQKNYRPAYFNLLLIVVIWIAGSLFSFIPWTKSVGQPISVGLVQGNIPQELKWSRDHLQLSFDRYQKLTEPLWGKDQLIIWPEAAIPLPMENATTFISAMNEKVKSSHSQLILGIPTQAADGKSYHNAVVALGEEQKMYVKRRLVPFGEYVPFSNLFSHLFQFMDIPMSDLTPGKINQDPMIVNGIKILTSICYEIGFPELSKSNDETINLLLTVTNDAWFGKSSAQAQHLQMAEMRAMELRRPVLFASNDGITAIIDADGKIESAAPAHQAFVLNGTVQPKRGLTPWMRNGMDPILFILFCLIVIAIRSNKIAVLQQRLKEKQIPIKTNEPTDQ